jgi:hypothetical protein
VNAGERQEVAEGCCWECGDWTSGPEDSGEASWAFEEAPREDSSLAGVMDYCTHLLAAFLMTNMAHPFCFQ